MDSYHPDTVFSSIDQQGRYSYSNQPRLAHWNVAQLASSLLPLIDPDQERAIELATRAVDEFVGLYRTEWASQFTAKIGVNDAELAKSLLDAIAVDLADFTNTFRNLSTLLFEGDFGSNSKSLNRWLEIWRPLAKDTNPEALDRVNPSIIPRNHQIEAMITTARQGDFELFESLNDALSKPFEAPADHSLTMPPKPEEIVQATFCGT